MAINFNDWMAHSDFNLHLKKKLLYGIIYQIGPFDISKEKDVRKFEQYYKLIS